MNYEDTIATAARAFQNKDMQTVYDLFIKSIDYGQQGLLIRNTINHMTNIYYPNFNTFRQLIDARDKAELEYLYHTNQSELYKKLESKQLAGLYLTLSFNDGKLLYKAVVYAAPENYSSLTKAHFNQNTINEYIDECVRNEDTYSYKVLLSYYSDIDQCIPGLQFMNSMLIRCILDVLLDMDVSKSKKKDIVRILIKKDLQTMLIEQFDNLDFERKVYAAKYISRIKLKYIFKNLHKSTQYALLHWRLKRSSSLRKKFLDKGELVYGGVRLTIDEYKKYF